MIKRITSWLLKGIVIEEKRSEADRLNEIIKRQAREIESLKFQLEMKEELVIELVEQVDQMTMIN